MGGYGSLIFGFVAASSVLGAAAFSCVADRRGAVTIVRAAVVAGAALVPVAILAIGVALRQPFPPAREGRGGAVTMCLLLAALELLLLIVVVALSAKREGTGAGIMLAAVFTIVALGMEAGLALLASGQLIAGASL